MVWISATLFSRRSLGLYVMAVLVPLRIWDPLPIEELRLRSFDLYQHIKPRNSAIAPVRIVDIDEDSISKYGQWPWPRTLIADLLASLYEHESVAIAFDIVFPEPDRLSPGEAAKYFRGLDEITRENLSRLPNNDEVLARAI